MRHQEETKFCAYALWLSGYDAGIIGHWLGMRRSQALGICQRGPWRNRSSMTLAERQVALDELKAIRFTSDGPLDRGRLDRFDWRALDLECSQVRT